MEENWNNYYNNIEKIVFLLTPVKPGFYDDPRGVAYWQWADARMTMNDGYSSVTEASNTVTGFPEISYFHSERFNKVASAGTVDAFVDVKLYKDDTIPEANYFNLFELYDADGNDPDKTSLFNLDNLKMLIDLGHSTPNVLNDTSLVYGDDFTLSDDW